MRYVLLLLTTLAFAACAQSKHYNTGIAKTRTALTLNPAGDYYLRQEGTMSNLWEPEYGKWWYLTDNVVLLLPDKEDKPDHYVWVSEQRTPFGNLFFYEDLRPALLNAPASRRPIAFDEKPDPAREAQEEQAKLEELKGILAKLNPGPLSIEEYRSLTQHPYSRQPFLEHDVASRAYLNGFRDGFAKRTRNPGQLYLGARLSGSIIDAARDAGFSAGMIGDLSQLTEDERQEVEDWKQKYREASWWPYQENMHLEMELKSQEVLKNLELAE